MSTVPPELNTQRKGWISRTDQVTVAGLVAIALAATVAWWFAQGGAAGGLVELDRAKPQAAQFQIDVNSADWAEIAQLPDVGPVLAKRIVEYRTEHGGFEKLEDLRNVRGMGPITFSRVSPYLRPVESSPEP